MNTTYCITSTSFITSSLSCWRVFLAGTHSSGLIFPSSQFAWRLHLEWLKKIFIMHLSTSSWLHCIPTSKQLHKVKDCGNQDKLLFCASFKTQLKGVFVLPRLYCGPTLVPESISELPLGAKCFMPSSILVQCPIAIYNTTLLNSQCHQ